MKRRAIGWLAGIGMLHAAGVAVAAVAPGYQLTDLGIASGYTASFAYGMSDNGKQVAGWVDNGTSTQAFRWSTSTGMVLLGNGPGATASRGFSVNDQGLVAGETSFGTPREATVWTGTSPAGLGTLSNAGSSVAFGINNAGNVVGWSDSSDGTRAFSWESGSGMSCLGTRPGGTQTRAYNINASGQSVGWGTTPAGDRGFTASPALSAVPTISGTGGRTRAFGNSNDNGWVAGDAQDPTLGDVAFVWSPTGGTVAMGLLAGAARSFGADVNSDGVAVGWADGLPGGEQAYVWSTDTGMVALDSLLVGTNGWSVQRARGINDSGAIIGNAMDANGAMHAVLLTPVPEPSTWALLGLGLLVTGAWRRRVHR